VVERVTETPVFAITVVDETIAAVVKLVDDVFNSVP
jgi:hypothetical protein